MDLKLSSQGGFLECLKGKDPEILAELQVAVCDSDFQLESIQCSCLPGIECLINFR